MKHLCILFVYNNVEHIQQCFDSLKDVDAVFWVVENHSEYSPAIQEYFSKQDIEKYFYFVENITNNALRIVIEDYWDEICEYDYLTLTDTDLLLDDGRETMSEVIGNLQWPDVGVSCVSLKMDNFPHWEPSAHTWIVEPISENEHYIECFTGAHLMTFKREHFDLLRRCQLRDVGIASGFMANRLKWVRTRKSHALHLTWFLCKPDHPYYLYKAGTPDLWSHKRTCGYARLK